MKKLITWYKQKENGVYPIKKFGFCGVTIWGPGLHSWRRLLGPGKMGFCGQVCEVALSHRRRFHLVGFSISAASGMRNLSLLSDFCSCGRDLHYPLVACLDLSPVRGSRSCPAVGSLRVPLGADLILSFLMVSLAEAQVLPIDGVNCNAE